MWKRILIDFTETDGGNPPDPGLLGCIFRVLTLCPRERSAHQPGLLNSTFGSAHSTLFERPGAGVAVCSASRPLRLINLINRRLANILRASVLNVRSLWLATISGGRNETDIPSSEPKASAQARLPTQKQDEIRPRGAQSAPPQGTQATRSDDSQEVDRVGSGRYRFPRGARIRRRSEIQELFRRGKRLRTGHLDVFVTDSPALRTRLALVVPKHGHKIVERNRLRRRLRETARVEFLPVCREREARLDVLIRARPEAYAAGFSQLITEISALATQLCSHGPSSS